MSETRLILHVKGTEAETAEMPKAVVQAAISQGDLSHSQLIWCRTEHAWKQAREFPDLLPVETAEPEALNETAEPEAFNEAALDADFTPADEPEESPVASSPTSYLVKEAEDHNHPVKWIFILLGLLILIIVTGNYLLVEKPLAANLRQTAYARAPVYAHFGGFLQPNVILIHIPVSKSITADNLIDFLANLAACTPDSPIRHYAIARVALTAGWTAQYSLSGYNWKLLGAMKDDDAAARQEFFLAQLADASGEPLLHASSLNKDAQKAARDQVWQDFVAHFTAP